MSWNCNRNKEILKFTRMEPCIFCGRIPTEQFKNEAHHPFAGGMGIKCSDWYVVPVCPPGVNECHSQFTDIAKGKKYAEEKYGIDIKKEVILNMERFLETHKKKF